MPPQSRAWVPLCFLCLLCLLWRYAAYPSRTQSSGMDSRPVLEHGVTFFRETDAS